MNRYKLTDLAKRPKGTTTVLPVIEGRLGTEKQYLRHLRRFLKALGKETRDTILPLYTEEVARNRRLAKDEVGEEWFIGLRAITASLNRVVTDLVGDMFRLEASRHSNRFRADVKRVLGINLASVVVQEDLKDYLAAAAARNASLIKSLGADTVKRVEQTIVTGVITGQPVSKLRKELTRQFGIADKRAQLIARDQVGKFNADLNRIRHEQAGVTEYEWMTSRDERVRARHRKLHGTVYTYGKPTGAESGLPPGQPIRCRCVARAVVRF